MLSLFILMFSLSLFLNMCTITLSSIYLFIYFFVAAHTTYARHSGTADPFALFCVISYASQADLPPSCSAC